MPLYRRVRSAVKKIFDNIRNEKLKDNLLQAIPYWVASLLTGLIAVGFTRLFAYAEQGTSYIFLHHRWWLFLFTPVCFLTAWWLVARFAPFARGSGIPQVMASIELATPKTVQLVDKLLGLRIMFIKILSSLIMVLGGGVIGREGPTIQIAGSIFRKVQAWLPKWWPKISRKTMIMTGAAAGLAAAFNTPLGGIVFAVEELTKTHISYFKTALFTAVIIAGLTAQGMLGPYLYLGYPNVTNLSAYVLLAVVLIAIIAGLAGSTMSKIVLKLLRWKCRFGNWKQHVAYVIICALIITSIALLFDHNVLGSGKALMTQTLFTDTKYVHWYTAVFRTLGPIICFTTGVSGGIFAPSLSAGASIGSVLAGWFDFSASNANVIILAGMVSFLTGVTRSPFTSAILVLEMTDRHSLIFHLMLAGMVASIVSLVVDKHSIYDHLSRDYMHEVMQDDGLKG
jgi:H+/Cl- antiporter ClcA